MRVPTVLRSFRLADLQREASQLSPAAAGPRLSVAKDVIVDGLVEARNALARQMPLLRVTPSVLVLRAVSRLLAESQFEVLNSRVEGDEVRVYKEVNVAIPVYAGGGVRIAVVEDVSSKSLAELVSAVSGARAEAGLPVSEATFMFVNVGVMGIDFVGGISYPSISASLAMGRIRRAEVYDESRDRTRLAYVSTMTLTVDPRVVGPDVAGSFLASLEGYTASSERLLEIA